MLTNLSKVTPQTNPELWYSWYAIVKEDAPEVLDEFIENTAAKMEIAVDVFLAEWINASNHYKLGRVQMDMCQRQSETCIMGMAIQNTKTSSR